MSSSSEILLSPGETLYREGDPNDCGYIIESGEIILFSEASGRRVNCERRGAGAILGELSILTGRPRAVTVEAVTHCRLFEVPAKQVLERFQRLDPILRACVDTSISFSANYTERLHKSASEVDDVTHPSGVALAPSTLSNADELVKKLRLEIDIAKGLENGEFSLVYQPIVRLEDRCVVGVEALMRWRHPKLGNIPPDRFIAIAEEMESINKLTEFALLEASAFIQRIRTATPANVDFFVSVNISGKDIVRDGFVAFVSFLVDKYEMKEKTLHLELTETTIVSDSNLAEVNLARLREIGCGISIDDFGTGHSNLTYLKRLPVSTLKIDRIFAGDAHNNTISRSIVRVLLNLGRDLGVDVIAEGLETDEDVQTLTNLGCQFVQGYYFYKPLTEAGIFEILAQDRTIFERAG